MHRVKRAIIMAAGRGRRLWPITQTTPKPLVRVNGIPMIESIIQGLYANGITEIYIVVGHLKERFYYLQDLYKGVTLIDNPYYDTCNNISSLYAAREYIRDCMILDGDLLVYNNTALKPEFEYSCYNCIWTEQWTEEWLLTVEHGFVTNCSRTGGRSGWQLYSVSRWSETDGTRLKRHLEIEFEEKKNRQIYWDDIALFCYPQEYRLSIFPMEKGDILEIDNLEELITLDKSYGKYGGSADEKF